MEEGLTAKATRQDTSETSDQDSSVSLYRGRDGLLVQAVPAVHGKVTFCELGSSYRVTLSRAAFDATFEAHSLDRQLAAGVFRGAWLPSGARIKGYASDVLWNGWCSPHFTKAEGLRLVVLMKGQIAYDEGADSFVDASGGFVEACAYRGRDWTIGKECLRLYGIGEGVWCWRRVAR